MKTSQAPARTTRGSSSSRRPCMKRFAVARSGFSMKRLTRSAPPVIAPWRVDVAETGRGKSRLQADSDQAVAGRGGVNGGADRPRDAARCRCTTWSAGSTSITASGWRFAQRQRGQPIRVGGAAGGRLEDEVRRVDLGQDLLDDVALARPRSARRPRSPAWKRGRRSRAAAAGRCSPRGSTCFGVERRDRGHRRVPAPPAGITATVLSPRGDRRAVNRPLPRAPLPAPSIPRARRCRCVRSGRTPPSGGTAAAAG